MGVFTAAPVFSGLGKASLKLDFDTKEELNDYCARMLAASNTDDDGDEPEGGDRYLLHSVRGLGEFTKEEFINLLTENPAEFYFYQNPDQVFKKHIFVDYPNTLKKAYIVNTPIEEVKIWADFDHIKGDNSTNQDRTKIIGLIKPTLETPDLIYNTEQENNYIKSFKSEDGKNIILILIPTTKTNGFLKTHTEKKLSNIYNKIKGGENIIYRRTPESTHHKVDGLYFPFDVVELHLPTITQTSPKGLNAPGDYYYVRDIRTRAKKEPGELASNKNLEFEKDNSKTIQNFNRAVYLAEPESAFFSDKVVNGKRYVQCTVRTKGRYDSNDVRTEYYEAEIWYFIPRIKMGKNAFKGSTLPSWFEVNFKDLINLNSVYSSLTCYIVEDTYKKLFNKALKQQIDHFQYRINKTQYAGEAEKELKYFIQFYTHLDDYKAYETHSYGDPTELSPKYIQRYKELTDLKIFEGLGRTADNTLYNNNDLMECQGLTPTYKILPSYDGFFSPAEDNTAFAGFGLKDTKKLISEYCKKYWRDCLPIANHLKGDSLLQSCFNLWHWMRHNIRYEYDRDGREEVRSPRRVWQDRHRGVDCDCLSVFAWCVLYAMGYNPQFELVAFKNKPDFSHIFINCDGVVVDRVWYVFNSRPPGVTKRELYKVNINNDLGKLF